MKKILFFAHRKKIFEYFRRLASSIPNSKVFYTKNVVQLPLSFYLPDSQELKKLLGYECRKLYYRESKLHKASLCFFLTLTKVVEILYYYPIYKREIKKSQFHAVVLWGAGGLHQKLMALAAKEESVKVIYMENGFLPNTTAIDDCGVNANCNLPRSPEFYINFDLSKWPDRLPDRLIPRKPKAKIEKKITCTGEDRRENYVFVPFQCNSDSVIIMHSSWIKNMWDLFYKIVEVASKNKDIDFIIKEHPSCPEDYSNLYRYLEEAQMSNVKFDNKTSTEELIKGASAVITINSSVGFESLLFSKPVVVLGDAAYCITDLVLPASGVKSIHGQLRKIIAGKWVPSQVLTKRFLTYVYYEYLVQGTRNEMSNGHVERVCKKIKEIIKD